MAGETYLETERLILRRFTDADVDALVLLDSDPEVTRYLTRVPPDREKVASETIPRVMRYYDEHPQFGTWATIERASGEFIGWFHLRPPHHGGRDDEPELGYRFRRAAWGKGYATEGGRALVDRAFTELGARRVFALTMAVNAGSRRVMEKVGLRYVRSFHGSWPERLPGAEHGDVEYAITRDQWERDRARRSSP
jgi:RimJ/RimL family protein N-acetyltransferase